jgi:glycosyltransferase involved in cell wall biosynthesis
MAQYALLARNQAQAGRPVLILDEHNACFMIVQRLAKGERNFFVRVLLEYEWRALKRYEANACLQFDHVITVTHEDEQTLRQTMADVLIAGGNVPVYRSIPICVDTRSVKPVEPQERSHTIVYMGTMFFLPNVEGVVWFNREVWPKVLEQLPDANFTIIGKNPPKIIQDLNYGHINVTGYVENPLPFLEKAAVFIVPLLSGGGMRVKIIDAWRWGLPIVSTTIGAEGIQYCDNENILIADDPEEFAQAVVKIIMDPSYALLLRKNGRKWVEEHYEWGTRYETWENIYSLSNS